MTRRKFSRETAVGKAAGVVRTRGAKSRPDRGEMPLIVSTWPFGKPANDEALKVLLRGGSLLDAVELGIGVTESDPTNKSVGLSGDPNAAGVVQLDACIMDGPSHKAGSVGALEGIRHPISAARRVMEKTKHVLLAGEGARMFALAEGLESITLKPRLPAHKADNHDTIALLVLGGDGNLAGGCSTSGLAGKLPGRVGDSPIIGSGLYVDNEVGAAGSTGIGENVMRYCAAFMIVEFMRQGMSPQEACVAIIRRILRTEPNGADLHINFVALDKYGRHGAAGTHKKFKYAVTTPGGSRVLPASIAGSVKAWE